MAQARIARDHPGKARQAPAGSSLDPARVIRSWCRRAVPARVDDVELHPAPNRGNSVTGIQLALAASNAHPQRRLALWVRIPLVLGPDPARAHRSADWP